MHRGLSGQGKEITMVFLAMLRLSQRRKDLLDSPSFSRLPGKAPIMLAGMMPTTVKAGLVSAILSAGYHVELDGGGHYNQVALRTKVAEIQSRIPPGFGLTLNSPYINPRQLVHMCLTRNGP